MMPPQVATQATIETSQASSAWAKFSCFMKNMTATIAKMPTRIESFCRDT